MGVLTRAKKRRLEEEEERLRLTDWISNLPDGVLGDIVSLLPTKDGARTQVLSSCWRRLWRSVPLNLEVSNKAGVRVVPAPREVSSILSSHPGPGRRFSLSHHHCYRRVSTKILASWLRSPALNKLQELKLHRVMPVPKSAFGFSSTLRVATFSWCRFPDGNNGSALHLPLLKQLSLVDTRISESDLHSMLAACPVLQSLLLRCCYHKWSFPRVQIVSPNLISIGVHSGSNFECNKLQQLVIKDAPCLEKLLFLGGTKIDVLVISAPRLQVLGKFSNYNFPRFHSGTTTVQGSNIASMTAVVSSVKVLALCTVELCLNEVINFMKCFPHLDKLYIQIIRPVDENWFRYQTTIGTLDIRLRKIVLANYQGDESQVKLAKFFISNARVLELMRFELGFPNVSNKWIERQRSLLKIEKRTSMEAQLDFVSEDVFIMSCSRGYAEVHDLSILDPFQKICQ